VPAGSSDTIHALVPLALLESVQALDAPAEDDPEEYQAEVVTRRLGTSRSVALQVARYTELASRDARVTADDVVSLLKLCQRRIDGALVFADAGRRAARRAVRKAGAALVTRKLLPGSVGNRYGRRLAGRLARRILDLEVAAQGDLLTARMTRSPGAEATPGGEACALYGSAWAALLYALTDFDGAVLHSACVARGDAECRWETTVRQEREP
jgi:hypothetical protein